MSATGSSPWRSDTVVQTITAGDRYIRSSVGRKPHMIFTQLRHQFVVDQSPVNASVKMRPLWRTLFCISTLEYKEDVVPRLLRHWQWTRSCDHAHRIKQYKLHIYIRSTTSTWIASMLIWFNRIVTDLWVFFIYRSITVQRTLWYLQAHTKLWCH